MSALGSCSQIPLASLPSLLEGAKFNSRTVKKVTLYTLEINQNLHMQFLATENFGFCAMKIGIIL